MMDLILRPFIASANIVMVGSAGVQVSSEHIIIPLTVYISSMIAVALGAYTIRGREAQTNKEIEALRQEIRELRLTQGDND